MFMAARRAISKKMVWIGVGMASEFQWQKKTHTSLESVGLMLKKYRFGPQYFAVVHEVLRSFNLWIPFGFNCGALRIRTADL